MQKLKQQSCEISRPLTSLLKNTALHFPGYSEAPAHAKLTEVSGHLPYLSPQLRSKAEFQYGLPSTPAKCYCIPYLI